MQKAAVPPNETQRLEALRQTGVLDTAPEESFDRLTDLAARICGAPMALITLVDVDRQWFKSHVGLEFAETPRDVSFCAHAILQPDILVVRDAAEDPRFADNPLVRSEPRIRFYAGCPLITHDGHAIGTFCVIDSVPRELDAAQVDALRSLARHTTTMLELRRTKELLADNAAAWERATAEGDRRRCRAELERLGENLRRFVAARERGELSVRDLERDLAGVAPRTAPAEPGASDVDRLLGDILACSDRLLGDLGPENPWLLEVIRIGAAARRARDLLREHRA